MGLITRDQLILLVQDSGGFTRENVEGFINYRSFNCLKVDQLKKIFKRLEHLGYSSLNRNVNKPQLIKQLQDFVSTYSEADGLFHAPNDMTYETPQPPRTPTSTSYIPTHPVAPAAPQYPTQTAGISSYKSQAVTPTSSITKTPLLPGRSISYTPNNSNNKPSSSIKRSLSQLSKSEMAIYRELSEIDGITADEIISALDDCPPLQRNANSILMLIIERKQVSSSSCLFYALNLTLTWFRWRKGL